MKFASFLSALGFALGCGIAPLAGAVAPPAQPEVQVKLPGGSATFLGAVRNGVASGLFSNGDRYEGEWKDGKPNGFGKMTYMLGGSYEGEWKNGLRDGKGIITFSGSGRQAEVRFADGRRVDVPAEPVSAATASARYSMRSDRERVGSHIKPKVVYGPLPLDQGYDQLSADQQRLVRSYYPALDAGDTPPYPLKGGKELYGLLVSLIREIDVKDEILVYVAVDADAKVTSVSTITPLDIRSRNLIAAAAGLLGYTPARCGGQPCAGVVPFILSLSVKD